MVGEGRGRGGIVNIATLKRSEITRTNGLRKLKNEKLKQIRTVTALYPEMQSFNCSCSVLDKHVSVFATATSSSTTTTTTIFIYTACKWIIMFSFLKIQ